MIAESIPQESISWVDNQQQIIINKVKEYIKRKAINEQIVLQNLKRFDYILQDHLFCGNMPQSNHFYFCFRMKKIRIQGGIAFTFPNWTSFKLQLYRNEHFISTTNNIYCAPNQLGELILQQQTFTFSLVQSHETGRQVCQIRLLQLSQESPEKVIGCYQFILNNYIKAYQELNRNSIEINVQIAQNFIILYDVFLERTEQALSKIMQQHETALKYHMQQSNLSQMGNFFPEQLENYSKDDIFKFVKIDQANPHLYGQQYYSSKKIKRYASIVSKVNKSNDEDQNMTSSLSTQPSSILHKRLKKTISTSDNLFKNSQPCSIHQIELDSDPEVEDRLKAFSQLYKVIENDSKIIEPQQLQTRPLQQTTKQPENITPNVKSKRSIKRFIAPITLLVLIILVVALFSVISYSFKRIRNRSKSSKMQFQFHKFSSFVTPKSFS